MTTAIIVTALIAILSLVAFFILGNDDKAMLKKRKVQTKDIFRENVLKKKLEKLTESKIKYKKRYAIETLCLQGGTNLTCAEFLIISCASALLVAIFFGTIFRNPLLAAVFLFIGFILPREVIVFLRNRRVGKMQRQIGSFMHMVLKRYDVTRDFSKSLELTLPEFQGEEPFYTELKKAVLEIHVGSSVETALDELARRTGNKYMTRLADYYKIAVTLGTDDVRKNLLSQAYLQYEENRKDEASLKKQLAGTKSEAYIMLATVPLFAIYEVFTAEDYISFMTTTTAGKIGTTAILATLIGCIWFINKKIGAPLE